MNSKTGSARRGAKAKFTPTKKKGNNNFINVLHEMIEVEKNTVIEWTNGGLAFTVHENNSTQVADVIGRYFRHNKYTS